MTVLWVIFIAVLASVGQVLLKIGVSRSGGTEQPIAARLLDAVVNPYIFVGLSIYAVCALLWLYVISRIPLSIAYPVLSLTFVFVPVFAHFFFGDVLSFKQWIGLILLVVGVVVFYL